MRVRFRIRLYREGRLLTVKDLRGDKSTFSKALRYILEFKYLEATKWLMLSQDTVEKYLLLGLIYMAIGQEDMANELMEKAEDMEKEGNLKIVIEFPDKGESLEVRSPADLGMWHTKRS